MKKINVLICSILIMLSVTGCGTVIEQVKTDIEINSEYNLLDMFSSKKGDILSINNDSIDITKVGTYKVSINATKNGKTKTYDYVVNVVDTVAPSYKISEEPLVFCVGDEVDFCDYVVVEDNSAVEIIPKFEKKFVDYNAVGEYKVNFTICDNSNNVSSGSLNFSIINYSVSEEIEIMGVMSNSNLSIASIVFKNIGTKNIKNIELAYILYDENMMPTSGSYEIVSLDNINLIPGEITTFTFTRKNHTYAEFVVTKIEYEGGTQWEIGMRC